MNTITKANYFMKPGLPSPSASFFGFNLSIRLGFEEDVVLPVEVVLWLELRHVSLSVEHNVINRAYPIGPSVPILSPELPYPVSFLAVVAGLTRS